MILSQRELSEQPPVDIADLRRALDDIETILEHPHAEDTIDYIFEELQVDNRDFRENRNSATLGDFEHVNRLAGLLQRFTHAPPALCRRLAIEHVFDSRHRAGLDRLKFWATAIRLGLRDPRELPQRSVKASPKKMGEPSGNGAATDYQTTWAGGDQ